MTPTRRPAATAGRLLAHGLGLGLLAGGVVLGAQEAAQAIQYVFADGSGNTNNGLQLSFDSDEFGRDASGTASVTGRFDVTGSNLTIVEDIVFEVESLSSSVDTVSFTFAAGTDAYYDFTNNILYFGIASGTCPGGTSGGFFTGPNCLSLQLSDDSVENGAPTAGFQSELGDYLNLANDDAFSIPTFLGPIIFERRERELALVNGQLLQIPAPISVLALLPLAGLKRYRRRFQRLSQAREAVTSAAELG